jgi:hypothetical protein
MMPAFHQERDNTRTNEENERECVRVRVREREREKFGRHCVTAMYGCVRLKTVWLKKFSMTKIKNPFC